MYGASRFEVDLEPFPTIRRVYDNLKALPAIQQADAVNQPDASVA